MDISTDLQKDIEDTVSRGQTVATESTLQAFTANNGRVPEGPFEGIQDRVTQGEYLIQVVGVLSYLAKSFNEIKDAKYLVTLTMMEK